MLTAVNTAFDKIGEVWKWLGDRFNDLGINFDDFKGAIDRGEFVGREAEEAFLCVQLISTAYASARDGSKELPLAGLAALEGDDVSDRMIRQVHLKDASRV